MAEGLERSILSALECPICDNYVSPPIRQCERGHIFCDDCYQKLEFCAICQSPKNLNSRCWVLEKVYANLSVLWEKSFVGCSSVCSETTISQTQDKCEFKCRPCPFRDYDGCPWENISSRMEAHLLSKHSRNFYNRRWQKLVVQNFKRLKSNHYIYAIIHAYNEFFRITWDLDVKTGSVFLSY